MPDPQEYPGYCHCRHIAFSVRSDLADPVWCNCSFCTRRGAILQKVPAANFTLLNGEEYLTHYGTKSFSDHCFCKQCGIHVFTNSTRRGEAAVIVNLACLVNVDVKALTPREFDGATLL